VSRAFVRESDQDPDALLPDRPVSAHPNLVTAEGLRQIELQIKSLEGARQEARAAADQSALARTARELRYWTQRLKSARLVEPPQTPAAVRFGVRVTLRFGDGAQQAFRIVGEDQADPAAGLLSYVSPLAAAAIGAEVGDVLKVLGREAEVLRIEA